MDRAFNGLEPLFEKVDAYYKTSLELYKLKLIGKTAEIASTIVSRGAVIIALCLFFVFASIGLALWLGDVLGKSYFGFFCVAGLFIVTGLVIYYFLHNYVKQKMSNGLIAEFFNETNEAN